MSYEEKTIVCMDCAANFIFSAEEQKTFASKGFIHEPKRCQACRDARKSTKVNGNREGNNLATSTTAGQAPRRGGGQGGPGGGGGFARGGGDRGPISATSSRTSKKPSVPPASSPAAVVSRRP